MKNILIVDDQFGMRILLKEVFSRGYKVFQAIDGVKALEILDEHDIDLILLDMRMPGMNGVEMLRRAKSNGFNNKVITMSAYNDDHLIAEAKELGACMHFEKPLEIMELIDAVNSLFPDADPSVFGKTTGKKPKLKR